MVETEFVRQWLRDAPVGDSIVYHTGFLAQDRMVRDGNAGWRYIEPTHSIGTLMEMARDVGRVELYQERVAEFEYKYWARKL